MYMAEEKSYMKQTFQQRFGENFRRIRKNKNLTQDVVAERAGMSPSYISEVENGMANPKLSTAEKLATGLDVEVFDLFIFLHVHATPAQIRKRLKAIVDYTDNKGLKAVYDGVLEAFKPG